MNTPQEHPLAQDEVVWRLVQATPRTWVTTLFLGLNFGVWVLTVVLGGLDFMNPDPRGLLAWGGNFLPATLDQPWRLFSATLLHGGVLHLAFNLWALRDTGRLAERFYGNGQFLLIYVCSGLAASMASLFFAAQNSVSVGASGAIFGVVGALMAAIFLKGDRLPPALVASMRSSMLFFAGYSLFMGFVSSHIDNSAHLGGLACGFGMAAILCGKFESAAGQRQTLLRACAAVALVMVVLFTAWRLLPRSVF